MTGRSKRRPCSSSIVRRIGASHASRPFSGWRFGGVFGKLSRGSLGSPRWLEDRVEEWGRGASRQIAGAVFTMAVLLGASQTPLAAAQMASQAKSVVNAECRLESVDYQGWQAQRISNRWIQLIILPQNGGRLLQVSFDGHAYLFVNPKLAGKYIPPSQDEWFNYGGDKLWLLPEGDNDEQH